MRPRSGRGGPTSSCCSTWCSATWSCAACCPSSGSPAACLPPVGRGFARLLDSAARPFHAVNYHGSCAAARYYNRHRMGADARMDREITALKRALARETQQSFARAVPYPTRWDPCFRDRMSIADAYRYPGRHFDHHRRQLTL
jgi:hypothetical protein